jgi:hypothetical protein
MSDRESNPLAHFMQIVHGIVRQFIRRIIRVECRQTLKRRIHGSDSENELHYDSAYDSLHKVLSSLIYNKF